MSTPVVLPCGGLRTDPSPFYDAQSGALRVADDVLIDRDGLARPRYGFPVYAAKDPTSQRPRSMTSYDTAIIVNTWDGTSTWQIENTSSTITGGQAEPLDYQHSFAQFAEARRNLYWCSKAGVHKITSAADTTAEDAGMHDAPNPQISLSSAGTPVVLANNTAAAVRVCFVKRDANDLVVRSPPSPWQAIGNSSGAARDIQSVIPLPGYVAANDQIEIYRTNSVSGATTTPSDQTYLVTRYSVTSTDVTNGYATVLDTVTDANLAQELYSNGTREGEQKINSRPPACRALAAWNECMWFGGTIGPWSAAVDFKADAGNTAADGTAGWGRFQYAAASATLDSPTITGLASTNSVVVGQLATDNGAPGTTGGTIPVGSFVISKTATTVTLDQNCTATGAITLNLHDRIKIGAENFYASSNTSTSGGSYPTFGVGNSSVNGLAAIVAFSISVNSSSYYALAYTDPTAPAADTDGPGPMSSIVAARTVVIRQIAQFGTAPGVALYTTAGSYSTQLTSAGDVSVTRDDRPNRVYYSKPREPEHVPETVNWIEMGSVSEPILAMAPLRAALLVFKTDGVYRITGSPPNSWRVDMLDPSLRVLRGECMSVIADAAAVWARKGVHLVNEGGAQNISDGAISFALKQPARWQIDDPTTTGCFVGAWQHSGLVLVGVPSAQSAKQSTHIYAYSMTTRAWSRWVLPAYCLAWKRDSEQYMLARGGAYWEIRGTGLVDPDPGYDNQYSPSGWTYTAGSTTITLSDAQLGTWVPKADDWVMATIGGTNYYRRVTAAVDTGTAYDLTIDSAFPAGSQTAIRGFEGIVSKLQWQAVTVGKPSRSKMCNGIHVLLDWTAYSGSVGGSTARLLVGGSTDVTPTVETVSSTGETRAAKSLDLSVRPPRNIARGSHHYPYLETSDIGLDWKCAGVTLDYEPMESERTNR